MKRFYTLVSTHKVSEGFEIHLDGKAVKTPARGILCAPTQAIADAVMQEWQVQADVIHPETIPLTQILSTKIDRVIPNRKEMHEMIIAYLDTDLVCYFADDPEELIEMQKKLWDPVLDFFRDKFGTPLKTTDGLKALTQDSAAHEAVRTYIGNLCDDRFTILQLVCALSGSLVLAIALLEEAINAQDLIRAIYVEEDFKTALYKLEAYGDDPEIEKIRVAKTKDVNAALCFVQNL